MGKVKSAIITAFVVAAVLILSLFAVISCPLNDVERYNSFVSSIHMGSDLTGEAYALFYPEGVISEAEYLSVVNDPDNENRDEYMGGYSAHPSTDNPAVYVENEKYKPGFAESVEKDAAIISNRFGEKGYTKYSVSVINDYVIRVSVPTNFTYAALVGRDTSARETELTKIGNTMQYMTWSGELDLKNGNDENAVSVISVRTDFADFFDSINYTGVGGNHLVRMNLNDYGYKTLNDILLSASEGSVYIYVGDTCTQLQINYGETLQNKTLAFSVNENYARDYAISLNSVLTGNILENSYNDGGADTEVIALTPAYGESAVVWLFVLLLLVLVGAIVYSGIKYKYLGLVNGLILLAFSAIMITALLLIEVQLTVGGAFTLLLGLALLAFTNMHVFEAVRKETLSGRTIQASVKTGYKKTLTAVLDMHIVVLVISALVALICKGELAACGLILFIATIASYALYWFTRLMWFVISSLEKDKFKFCGFKREAIDDED